MNIVIFFASTSGSTRFIVKEIVDLLESHTLSVFDLSETDANAYMPIADFLILITPSYGTGDWHYQWGKKGSKLLSNYPAGTKVALLGLGDSRGHKKSFAGGIGILANLARDNQFVIFGKVDADEYEYEFSHAVENGMFPGLVVEYRKNRRKAIKSTISWISSIIDDL